MAKHLFWIFAELSAPLLLQSDNGKEFRNQVVRGLKMLWPSLQIVHGRSRRPQTQGSVDRANGDFQPTESREQVKTVKDLYSDLSGIIFSLFSIKVN